MSEIDAKIITRHDTDANWNGRPRIYVFMKAGENLLKCVCISAHE